MTLEFLQSVFPKYTEAMYEGNEPCGKGHEHVSGGFCDRWSCKWGGGETYHGAILHADFYINRKVTIHICGDSLWVVDIRYSGKSDVWQYCVNHSGMPGYPCTNEKNHHELEWERLEQYLNTTIPGCKFWEMVRERVWQLVKGGGGDA